MAEPEDIYIAFDDDSLALVEVTRLTSNQFRMEMTPLLDETQLSLGDIIELTPVEDTSKWSDREYDIYKFIRIVSKTPYKRYGWILGRNIVSSVEFKEFSDAIVDAGGQWELALGGVFTAYLPPDSTFAPEAALDRVHQRVQGPS